MTRRLELHPDRLLPADPATRNIARELYAAVKDLPIVSPHGHTDPAWFATNQTFGNATDLLLVPDHYVFRMLYSQGVALADLGVGNPAADPRRSHPARATRAAGGRCVAASSAADLPAKVMGRACQGSLARSF